MGLKSGLPAPEWGVLPDPCLEWEMVYTRRSERQSMGTGVSSLTLLETPVESGAGGGGKAGFVCAWGMGRHSGWLGM